MANFFKESTAELEHVVWPTHIETKKFFQAVVSIIVAMTIFTYLLTLIFSNGLFALRGWIHTPATADLSGSPVTMEPVGITTESGDKIEVTAQPVTQ
ncbi:preprotein translocase subunit SecE [Candidatus Gracilibacteria bacterium]|nr:preprotein translocase subunit SecE [Candidatus Gracilibacteria bacterium]